MERDRCSHTPQFQFHEELQLPSHDKSVRLQSKKQNNHHKLLYMHQNFKNINCRLTRATSLWNVSLCCWDSTAANAADASLPSTAMFPLSSCILSSEACNFVTFSATGASRTRACLLETSAACLLIGYTGKLKMREDVRKVSV